MEAQKLITLSINKIAGSRRQRGGINLRKNLLVASVLHSARIHYYEEMCNRMPGHIALEQSSSEPEMDEDDCTDSDWDNDDESDESGAEYAGELDTEENNETAGNSSCESETVAVSRVVVEPAESASAVSDKENIHPSGHCASENAGHLLSSDNHSCHSTDSDRVALGNVTAISQNSSVETCTTTTCLTVPSVKRKRTETEEACEAIIPKRAKVDSQCQTSAPERSTSSISSLVDIFKAGFHGLAGESSGKLSSYDVEKESSSPSSGASYTTLTSRPFETLQTAVIAAC
ncbi:uncharacterized protein [Diadema antillarum]|uniref:uncharacterized protein n=1 Tax=Diadema antillarum TaxID=105358 RepID=UPI003A84CE41